MMLFALVIVAVVMLVELGGPAQAVGSLESLDPSYTNFLSGASVGGIISLLAWGLGYFGQPHILVRFMAIRSPERMGEARLVGMSWMIVSIVSALAVGLFGIGYLDHLGEALPQDQSEQIFIVLTQMGFNPWIAGILLAGILAAVMSTIDSQLLVSSSALSEDFYKTWLRPGASQRELVFVGRLTMLIISAVAIAIATDLQSKVLGLVSYAWAGLGASFGPVLLISLYWKGMTRDGALVGMIVGAVTVVMWKQLHGGVFDLYELLPAFVFSSPAVFVVSKLTGANLQPVPET